MMKTSLFDYHLPKSRIAQRSVQPRDSSRLLVLDRSTGKLEHRVFRDIVEYLRPGDLLVMNDTKVFRARLRGKTERGTVEIFLLHPERGNVWSVLARPGKKLAPSPQSPPSMPDGRQARGGEEGKGVVVRFGRLTFGTIVQKVRHGVLEMEFNCSPREVMKLANRIGEVPIPPYIKRTPKTLEEYQTIYARKTGSVAAPTAGFHFTPRLMKEIKKKGIRISFVTLHVGLGTFQPVKTERLEEHPIHAEWGEIPSSTASAIRNAKRVIAVGTTTVRALEGLREKRRGWIRLFIKPGYRFKVVDALITNFHLPRSTLLALVSAFAGTTSSLRDETSTSLRDKRVYAGRERILRAYRIAIRRGYRFYSFGDAMFIHSIADRIEK